MADRKKKLTTIRLDAADVRVLTQARAAGLSTSTLVRNGLRLAVPHLYAGGEELESCELARQTPQFRDWLKEKQAFDRIGASVLSRLRGRWVAVHKGKIVDHDEDEDTLYERMSRRLGSAPFFIGRAGVASQVVDMPGFVIE